jgi:hypothetical protein
VALRVVLGRVAVAAVIRIPSSAVVLAVWVTSSSAIDASRGSILSGFASTSAATSWREHPPSIEPDETVDWLRVSSGSRATGPAPALAVDRTG